MVLGLVELSTFGSLLRFAIELERQAKQSYGNLAFKVQVSSATELFSRYAREYIRRLKLLEGLRQRSINEVLLEPISNMDSKLYSFSSEIGDIVDMETALNTALDTETRIGAFYSDALKAAEAALGEASRVFRRLSEENSIRKTVLSSLRRMSTT